MNWKIIGAVCLLIVAVAVLAVTYMAPPEVLETEPQEPTPVFDIIDDQDVGSVELIEMEPLVFNVSLRRKTVVQ